MCTCTSYCACATWHPIAWRDYVIPWQRSTSSVWLKTVSTCVIDSSSHHCEYVSDIAKISHVQAAGEQATDHQGCLTGAVVRKLREWLTQVRQLIC